MNFKSLNILIIALTCLSFTACNEGADKDGKTFADSTKNAKDGDQKNTPECDPENLNKVITYDGVEVEIRSPENADKNMLLLPGWGFSREAWCKNSPLCDSALKEGYRLIMPEMGKSIYATEHYPETKEEYKNEKTGTWLREKLIPYLQEEYCLLAEGDRNFVVGLSTGGRGAVLTCIHMPGLFHAAATISGDYDQRLNEDDKLMIAYYGPYKKFRKRWEGKDNIITQAYKLKTPVFIAHGIEDEVVGREQAVVLNQVLETNANEVFRHLNLVQAEGHDWDFWKSQVPFILRFFRQVSKYKASGELP